MEGRPYVQARFDITKWGGAGSVGQENEEGLGERDTHPCEVGSLKEQTHSDRALHWLCSRVKSQTN